MDRQPVSSSTIASIGYDPATETLEIEFHKTGLYRYFNVPQVVHESFITATSHGTFLNSHIKGQYAYERA